MILTMKLLFSTLAIMPWGIPVMILRIKSKKNYEQKTTDIH